MQFKGGFGEIRGRLLSSVASPRCHTLGQLDRDYVWPRVCLPTARGAPEPDYQSVYRVGKRAGGLSGNRYGALVDDNVEKVLVSMTDLAQNEVVEIGTAWPWGEYGGFMNPALVDRGCSLVGSAMPHRANRSLERTAGLSNAK